VNSNEKTSSLAPIIGGFALGAMCGLLVAARKGRTLRDGQAYGLASDDAFSAAHEPMTPQELAEERDLTANL